MLSKKLFVFSAIFIIIAQAATMLLSWVVSVAYHSLGIYSLLSGDGLRVMLCGYVESLSNRAFPLLILMLTSIGAMIRSGLLRDLRNLHRLDYRHRIAMQVCAIVIVVALLGAAYVLIVPHSPMLSVSGHFFPGPLPVALAIYVMLVILILAYSYVLFGNDNFDYALLTEIATYGLQRSAWLVVLYLMAAELVTSLRFVFSI